MITFKKLINNKVYFWLIFVSMTFMSYLSIYFSLVYKKPDYLINTHEWICVTTESKYVTTENSSKMFYEVKENEDEN